ncbi:MAG: hypothetical protein HKO66_07330 [Saprospiraceae bacterium]|nr:hypothetical protein [Bacteroidia bacterium]NNE15792.1 hypothetical protein [Saprospiraceae bacterium]NNL92025.1 hypothetical protein [Saprospiraceae bacterium]
MKGAVVMLAWPETRVTRTGAWYDPISKVLGLIKNDTYKVGHAAFCLIDYKENKAFYFDFGRYQAPLGYGRVRGANTDPELEIKTLPVIENNKVININEILKELKTNNSTHGKGYQLSAVRQDVNLKKVYDFIYNLQDQDHIKYAPFMMRRTNCSRFASKAFLKAGFEPKWRLLTNLLSLFPYNLPVNQITQKSFRGDVHIVDDQLNYHKLPVGEFRKRKSLFISNNKIHNYATPQIGHHDKYRLNGIGAHAFYSINHVEDNIFLIARYDDHNYKHFEHSFNVVEGELDLEKEITMSYPSHANKVTIIQEGQIVKLVRYA